MTDQLDAQCPRIPDTLLPHDGRFGCGPSKIRTQQLDALMRPLVMGTSHRQQPVRSIVASIRSGLRDLFSLPEGWEVALGNGGSTTFWAVATTSLIRRRSAHAVFGEFGSKFADEAARAPHLAAPLIVKSEPGTVATLIDEGAVGHDSGEPIDVAAYPHHETSTGALSPLYRVNVDDCLTVVDATSIAGGVRVDLNNVDVYYFSPQKCFGSDGGLWVALLSPAAQERAERLHGDDARWMPQILDLSMQEFEQGSDAEYSCHRHARHAGSADSVDAGRWWPAGDGSSLPRIFGRAVPVGGCALAPDAVRLQCSVALPRCCHGGL